MSTRNRVFLMLGDLSLVWLGLLVAVFLRTDFNLNRSLGYLEEETWFFLALSLSLIIAFFLRGLYHRLSRYTGTGDVIDILVCIIVTFLPFQLIAFAARGIAFPRAGLLLAFFPIFFFLVGFRLLLRLASEARGHQEDRSRFLIIGLNDAADVAIRELKRTSGQAVGILSLEPKQHVNIRGVACIGSIEDTAKISEAKSIDGLVLAGLSPSENLKVMRMVTGLGLQLRTVPPVSKLLSGEVNVASLRPLLLEDLLEREPISFDLEQVSRYLKGERILVTGAGGSIGGEIVRQCLLVEPKLIVLMGRGENSIFEIVSEIRRKGLAGTNTEIVAFVGNICDPVALSELFSSYKPTIVFHAAAHKHVPLMETRPVEACANNIFGTLQLMNYCQKYEVKRLVALSTDKAVAPSSVMGATKRVVELLLHTSGHKGFASVRFGNVLGSRGSVIPTMQAQIAAGGPLTLTSLDMQRYFMTIPEAVSLVLGAGAMASGGETYVLEMGSPVRISDLCENLIRLSGMVPYKDIDIKVTGIRPGEKLVEALFDEGERCETSGWSGIQRVHPIDLPSTWPGEGLELLRAAVVAGDEALTRRLLFDLLPH